jgi:hypothetical protein
MKASNPYPNFDGFHTTEPVGLGYEKGVTRRDPSVVLEIDGRYHVWYSKNFDGRPRANSGFTASIFHAVSEDGSSWCEDGEALPKGEPGRFDACGVFTPTVFAWEGRIYMLYTAMPEAFLEAPETTPGAIGLAVADRPEGPWQRFEAPAIPCGDPPEAFDSLRVDDACVVLREGKIFAYYKGRAKGAKVGSTQMGLAIAEQAEGPYVKYPDNPVLNSGHEVCVWPHGEGVGCLVSPMGPQKNTLQYSEDGRRFRKIADATPPMAPGPFRKDLSPGVATAPGSAASEGITWGLAMVGERDSDWPYLIRFETDLRAPSPAGANAPR